MEEQNQASALLVEMIQVAAQRGAFSRIEVNAINEALNKLKKPVAEELKKKPEKKL